MGKITGSVSLGRSAQSAARSLPQEDKLLLGGRRRQRRSRGPTILTANKDLRMLAVPLFSRLPAPVQTGLGTSRNRQPARSYKIEVPNCTWLRSTAQEIATSIRHPSPSGLRAWLCVGYTPRLNLESGLSLTSPTGRMLPLCENRGSVHPELGAFRPGREPRRKSCKVDRVLG